MFGEAMGSPDTILVCIRGNSGSGKSSIAGELRRRHGRGCALVEQDYLRRVLLRERDKPGGAAPALIAQTVRFALDHGYHVVLEGILHRSRYRSMLTALRDDHRGRSLFCYLDVSPETLSRHLTRPQATEFTAEHMSGWYVAHDVLGWPDEFEFVLPETTELNEAVAAAAGLPPDRARRRPAAEPSVYVEQPSRLPVSPFRCTVRQRRSRVPAYRIRHHNSLTAARPAGQTACQPNTANVHGHGTRCRGLLPAGRDRIEVPRPGRVPVRNTAVVSLVRDAAANPDALPVTRRQDRAGAFRCPPRRTRSAHCADSRRSGHPDHEPSRR